jgi:hypothetical protein
MASEHMTVGELSSFLMYAFWVGISIAGRAYIIVSLPMHSDENPCSLINEQITLLEFPF